MWFSIMNEHNLHTTCQPQPMSLSTSRPNLCRYTFNVFTLNDISEGCVKYTLNMQLYIEITECNFGPGSLPVKHTR